MAAPAAAAVGTVAWLSVMQRSGDQVEVASIPASTTTTQPAFDHDDRGEVLRLSPVPDGWVFAGERLEQAPSEASFIRSVYYAPVDGGESGIAVVRAELAAATVERDRAAGGEAAVTPAGAGVVVRDVGAGFLDVVRFVDDNLVLRVTVPPELSPDALAVFDAVTFVPPDPRCVTGEANVTDTSACEALRVEILPDGTIEPLG